MCKQLHLTFAGPSKATRILLYFIPMLIGVSAFAQLSVSFNVTQPSCYGLPNGSITATASGGVAPYSYVWSTAQTGPTISGLSAGSYSVTVTGSNGASITQSVVLTQPTLVNATIQANQCIVPFTVTVFGSGGVGPYTYYWSTGQTTATISNLPSGTYCVTLTDSHLCGVVECITLNYIPININLTAVGVTCPNGANGSVQATVTGGVPPYTYLWSNGGNTPVQTNLSPGLYTVTVTDINGCQATASATVANKPPININVTANQPTCTGSSNGSITTTVTGGTPGYSYLWSTGATTPNLTGLPAGNYSLTVTDINGCTKTTAVTLSPYSNLTVGALGTPQTCPGVNNGFATANANFGVQPYSFVWSNGGTTQVLTGLAPGIYTVTVTDAVGCTGTATATVAAAPPFQINVTGSNVSTCGVTNGVATANIVTGIPPFTYLWSNGGTTQSISGLGAGTYSVTVTNGNNCVATGSITITAPPPVFVTINSTPLVCQGALTGTATAIVTGGTAPFSYLWSNGATTQTISNLPAGTYSVTVTDAVGCTASATTIINQAPAINVSINGTSIVCGLGNTGMATVFVAGGTAPFSYLWSTGANTATITNLQEGTYSVTVTDANGCSDDASFFINVIDNLVVNTNVQNVLCFGGNTGSITATGSGGNSPYSFLWSNGSTNATISNLTAGNYTVTMTDINGCTATKTVSITQPPNLTLSLTGSSLVCPGTNNGFANATASGGTPPYSFIWSNGAPTANNANLTSGVYSVTVTDANGCTKTGSITLAAAPNLFVNIEAEPIVCGPANSAEAEAFVSGGQGPYSYMWSNGSNQESIEDIGDGTYTVTVTDANGCTAEDEVTINVISDFSLSVIPRNLLCNGDNSGGILVIPNGGTPPYTYQWSNGFTGPEPSNLAAGTYMVTVTESMGCTLTQSITITQPPVLMLTANGMNADCFGTATGMATAMAFGGTAPYSFHWSNSQNTQTATGLAAGTYSVTVTDANLCTKVTTVTINQPSALTLNVTTSTVTCAGGNNGSASAIVSGGLPPYTYHWSNNASTSTVTGLIAGSYGVTVTDANGCTATNQTVSVVSLPQITINFNVTNIICTNAAVGAISSSVSGGTPPYTYAWSNGSNLPNISGLAAGTYMLTVTDINGCTASGSTTVTQTPSLMVNVIADHVNCFGGADGTALASVTGGVGPFTYAWSNGQSGPAASGLSPGVISVTVTDINGCTGQGSATITQPTTITITTNPVNVTCNGLTNGSCTATATGGTPPYSFNWSNGQTGTSATGLGAGSYGLTVTDANNCTKTSTFQITQPPALTVSVNPTSGTCQGGNSGSATAIPSGGTPPYSYIWSTGQTTAAVSGLTNGIKNVTVTDAQGCTTTGSVTIATFPSPTCTATVIQEITTFMGSNGQAQVTPSGGLPPYTYHWSNGQNTPIATNLGVGTYNVTVTDANGCTTTCSVQLDGPGRVGDFVWVDLDQDGIQDAGEVGIPGVTVILSGIAESTPYADTTVTNMNGLYYFDVPPGEYKITFALPNGYNISPANAGANDALDSDGDPVMLMTGLFTIDNNEQNLTFDQGFYPFCINVTDAGVIGYDQYLCGPGNDPAPIISVVDPSGGSGPIEYLWMMSTQGGPFNASTWLPIPNSNSATYDPGPIYQTTYYTRCVRRAGCSTYIEGNIVVVVVGNQAVANINGSPVACTNQSVTYTVTGNTANPQVQWTIGPGMVAETPTNGSSITLHFTSFGIFTLHVSVTENGCTASNFKTITVNNCFSNVDALSIDVNVMDQQMRRVSIHWAMPENSEPMRYIVWRSADGENFSEAGQVTTPMDVTGDMEHFEFLDTATKRGRTYYRVEGVRLASSGSVMSNTKEAIIYGSSELALYYPNPVTDQLTIELFETFEEDVVIDVSSANGSVLQRIEVPANTPRAVINFAEYPSGAYFIRLRYGKTDVKAIKVLKR